jgi:hypothetical protein
VAHLTLKGRNVPSGSHVKYLCGILDKKITSTIHMEMNGTKAFKTSLRVYSIFKRQRIRANIKWTLHMALVRFILTCACPSWQFAADAYPMKLLRPQNKIFLTIGNCPRLTPTCELHVAFNIPYAYDFITILCRQQAAVILNHENANIHNTGRGEVKYKRLELGGGQAYDRKETTPL